MNVSKAHNLCSNGGEMLSYLYNEMAPADRELFELHLADCGTCIDDFAELSQSRYPVFEWKQLEFDVLPTPRVVIPAEMSSVSWFDKLRASFAFRPAAAFGGLAALAVLASLAAFVLMRSPGGSVDVAGVDPIATPAAAVQAQLTNDAVVESKPEVTRFEEPKVVKTAVKSPRPVRQAARPKAVEPARRSEPLPTLSSVDDDEDDSLRLADMFEEIGTGE